MYNSKCAELSTTTVPIISTTMILMSCNLNSDDGKGENSKSEFKPCESSNRTDNVKTNDAITAARRGL